MICDDEFYGFVCICISFSLELSKIHTIHIPAVDNDDDKLKCELSTFVEAGVFVSIVKNLTRARIITMKEKEV